MNVKPHSELPALKSKLPTFISNELHARSLNPPPPSSPIPSLLVPCTYLPSFLASPSPFPASFSSLPLLLLLRSSLPPPFSLCPLPSASLFLSPFPLWVHHLLPSPCLCFLTLHLPMPSPLIFTPSSLFFSFLLFSSPSSVRLAFLPFSLPFLPSSSTPSFPPSLHSPPGGHYLFTLYYHLLISKMRYSPLK